MTDLLIYEGGQKKRKFRQKVDFRDFRDISWCLARQKVRKNAIFRKHVILVIKRDFCDFCDFSINFRIFTLNGPF